MEPCAYQPTLGFIHLFAPSTHRCLVGNGEWIVGVSFKILSGILYRDPFSPSPPRKHRDSKPLTPVFATQRKEIARVLKPGGHLPNLAESRSCPWAIYLAPTPAPALGPKRPRKQKDPTNHGFWISRFPGLRERMQESCVQVFARGYLRHCNEEDGLFPRTSQWLL